MVATPLRMLFLPLLLVSLASLWESVPAQSKTQARFSTKEVICPEGCLKHEAKVWGSYAYTADSSICRAAINDGKVTNAGGRVRMENRPGQSSYQGSTRNGVITESYKAYPASFIFTITSPPPKVLIQCSTKGDEIKHDRAEVICPEGCLKHEAKVWGTDTYTADSSICRAAINDGKVTNAGGIVRMEKWSGQSSYQESTRNGVKTDSYKAYPASFIFPITSPPRPPEVPVQCSTKGDEIKHERAEVICPEGCLKQEAKVWGTDTYTDDSSICRAAINEGKITSAGGRVTVEKRPGQSFYQESTRNGVKAESYGAFPASFIFPMTSPCHPPEVYVQCDTTGGHIKDNRAEVICPEGCLKQEAVVWGSDTYTADSSICRAAINDGKVTNAGGRVRMEKWPGQSSYQGSTRNGVITESYKAYPASFIFPITSPPDPPKVPVQCSTKGDEIKHNGAEVICPEGCLKQEAKVWGNEIYTADSSICRAAINDGKVTNTGGRVRMEKRPGQSSYQESTRNGVKTDSYKAFPASFIFPITSPPPPEVPVQCSTTGAQIKHNRAEVICPEGCLKAEAKVWGTVTYTEDSSICRAAINDGKVTNAGGRVRMEKRPGQSSYQESTRNGVKTESYKAFPTSFIFLITSPPLPSKVFVQCDTKANQLT
ncbi:uncharacterized protein LOC144754948 isoform X2 [Lissotriton helveticus]